MWNMCNLVCFKGELSKLKHWLLLNRQLWVIKSIFFYNSFLSGKQKSIFPKHSGSINTVKEFLSTVWQTLPWYWVSQIKSVSSKLTKFLFVCSVFPIVEQHWWDVCSLLWKTLKHNCVFTYFAYLCFIMNQIHKCTKMRGLWNNGYNLQ